MGLEMRSAFCENLGGSWCCRNQYWPDEENVVWSKLGPTPEGERVGRS